jgi:hypothetical protein
MPSDLSFSKFFKEYLPQNPNTTEQWRSNKTYNIDNSKNNDHEWTKDGSFTALSTFSGRAALCVDDVTERLLDQLILQKTGTWQFRSHSQSQQQHPSAVRIATQSSLGVCTIFETSHLSLGWTWESATCFAVQLHLGSGCSAGKELNNAGICRVVHSVDAISAATSNRGLSDGNDENKQELLPLWVRNALQIQVILDPVECVVADSNSGNNSNYSSIPNHLGVASVEDRIGFEFSKGKR